MEIFFYAQILLHLLGGGVGFLFNPRGAHASRATHGIAVLASLAGVVFSGNILLTGHGWFHEWRGSLPIGPLSLSADPFSALFILIISLLSLAASVFAIGYVREYQGRKNIASLGLFYHAFILAMLLVVTVQNAFYFLLFWELMSLASYFLVIFEHEKQEARSAGTLYLVMTHIGTAFIGTAFWLLFMHSGSYEFQAFRESAAALPLGLKNVIFFAALIGFGTKAGVIPLHVWLPRAHPQAPSHVSALMSGVMIKMAIYGLWIFLFSFLGEGPGWWGPVVLGVAILSTFGGVLYALMENDLKKLLAFSSIENIGIVLLGIGMALVFSSADQPLYKGFSLIAALYHVINHAMFKGLLFLGAGSVLSTTHTGNIENLGGLIRAMPWTAAGFLVGAVAISALPPLNGFVSEWLIFISLLLGFESAEVTFHFFSPLLAALLGLAGALVATCFVKAFGISFLGQPRSHHAAESRESGMSMLLGMGILAATCLGLALGAPWVFRILGETVETSSGGLFSMEVFVQKIFFLSPSGFEAGRFSPLIIALVITVLLLGIVLLLRLFFGKASIRTGPSWDCGMPGLAPRMQYTSTGFSQPFRRILSFLYQPTRRVELEDEGMKILRTAQRFESRITQHVDEWVYQPLIELVGRLSRKVKYIQTGHIQLYLSYIFVTLILLLLFFGGRA
jgi:hydrogenase-4 component B